MRYLLAILLLIATPALAGSVKGYSTKKGYVVPHYRSNPDKSPFNNMGRTPKPAKPPSGKK